MNIKQARARFTELTGLPSNSHTLYYYAYTTNWLQRGLGYVADNCEAWNIDARHKEFWTLLVEYSEKL